MKEMNFMCYLCFSANKEEKGAYLLIIAFSLFSLLALGGLALDAANLYRARAALQKAAVASSISAARELIIRPQLTTSQIQVRAIKVAKESLKRDKIILDSSNSIDSAYLCFGEAGECLAGEPNPQIKGRYAATSIQFKLKTFILGMIPWAIDFTTVNAYALVENTMLNVVLVLDNSNSMINNNIDGPLDECADTANPEAGTRTCAMKYAAKELVDSLQNFDQLSVVTFDFDRGKWDEMLSEGRLECIDPTDIGCSTNPRPPLMRVIDTPDNWAAAQESFDADSVTVFSATTISGQANRDQIKADIDSITPRGTTGFGTNMASGVRRGWNELGAAPAPDNTISVMAILGDGAPWGYLERTRNTGDAPFTLNCNDPLYTQFPETNRQTKTVNQQLETLKEIQPVHENGILVYSIGVGAEATNNTTPFHLTPPPNADGSGGIVRNLLTYLANDQSEMLNGAYVPGWNIDDPSSYRWDFPCIRGGAQMSQYTAGRYINVLTGEDLRQAFLAIAEIRTSMTE